MAGVNKVILLGRLGKDPDLKYLKGDRAVCNFSLATSERWTKDGKQEEKTEWHLIKAFGKTAEIAGEYLEKGREVYVEGKLSTRKWDKDGETRYSTEVIIDHICLIGGKGSGDKSPGKARAKAEEAADLPFEDDIPF